MDKIISAATEQIINPLIILLFAFALIVFIWGLVKMIATGGEEDTHTTARRHILYGLLGMFIMVSAFALVRLITGTFIGGEQGQKTQSIIDDIEK